MDSASLPLWQALLNSSVYTTVTLYLVKAGGGNTVNYVIYTLANVGVSSLRHFFSSGDEAPTEEVVLVYSGIKLNYAKQNPDGSYQTPTNYGWNHVTNVPM